MKKIMKLMTVLVAGLILQCCTTDDPLSDNGMGTWTDNMQAGMQGSGTVTAGTGELLTFNVAIDKTTAEPATTAEAYYPEEEDNIANNSFTTEVTIIYDGNNVSYAGIEGVTVTADGAHVTVDHGSAKNICYVVSGTTDNGSLTIIGDKKYEVKLSGVDITNPDSTALNLLSKKRAFVVLSGSNRLADGTSSKAEDQKGALYCKGKLLVSGNGSLEVYGNYNNAIHSADYIVFGQGVNVYAKSTANHGIKANDGIFINGGILNVEVTAAAAKGINSESNIVVNGGRTTVITTGNGTYDSDDRETKAAAGIACDSTYTQNGGEVFLKSTGSGGKGLKTDYEAYISGGKLHILTTGGVYSSNGDTSSPKGIKIGTKNVHGLLNISGGNIMVRTEGQKGEGIESKGSLTISDGTVMVSAYDDAINSAGDMYLMGGTIVAVGRNNDGIDANGNMYIQGGNIVALGAGGAESGIDTGEQSRLNITGGQVFGIGGRIDASLGTASQAIISTTGSVLANATVTVGDGSTALATFTMPPYSTSGTALISAPGMTSGKNYTLNWGSQSTSATATSSLSSSMGGGMMPGGRR